MSKSKSTRLGLHSEMINFGNRCGSKQSVLRIKLNNSMIVGPREVIPKKEIGCC